MLFSIIEAGSWVESRLYHADSRFSYKIGLSFGDIEAVDTVARVSTAG